MRLPLVPALLAALLGVPALPQQGTAQHLALTDLTLIDGTGAAPRLGMTVVVAGDSIAAVFPVGAQPLPGGAEVIELSGRFLVPGLIESHVHFDQIGLGRDDERVHRELARMLYAGVTGARNAAGDARLLAALQRSLLLGEVIGPDIEYSALIAGPDFIAQDMRVGQASAGVPRGEAAWMQAVTPDSDAAWAVARAAGTHATGLKFYVGVDAEVIRAFTDEAHRRGLQAWAHTTVFPDRPLDVVRAGVDVVSHVCWIVWQDADLDPTVNVPYTHTPRHAPGPTFDAALVEADSPEMTMLFHEMAQRGTVFDATYSGRPRADTAAGERGCTRALRTALAQAAHRAGVPFATGTDYFLPAAEPFPAVFREIEELVDGGVLTPLEAITAATRNGARTLGREGSLGTIEPGKIANLVVLREDPSRDIRALRTVETVIKRGRRFARADYEAERDGATSAAAEARSAVRAALAAEQRAFDAGDCDAALRFYADSEPLFVSPARTFRTRRELLHACGTMTARRGAPPRRVEQEDVHVLGPDAAYTVTRYVVMRPRPDGTAESSPRVVSKLWARQEGRWRIVHVHESAPGRSGAD